MWTNHRSFGIHNWPAILLAPQEPQGITPGCHYWGVYRIPGSGETAVGEMEN